MSELTTALPSEEVVMRPRYYSVADQAISWVICVLALLGNSLTILTILKTRHGIGQKARLYILNLSLADILMVPTLVIELTLSKSGYMFQPLFDLGDDVMMNIYHRELISNILISYLYYFPMCTSLMTLFAVALDRMLAVGRPLQYRTHVTDFRIKLLLASIWLYAAFSGAWLFVFTGFQVTPERMLVTFNPIDFLPPFVNDYLLMPHMYLAVLGNTIAYFIAYRQIKQIGCSSNLHASGSRADQLAERNLRRNRRFFRMVVATICTQIIFWAPFGITYNIAPINRRDSPSYLYNYVQPFVYAMTISNSWINPFLYAALNKDYRTAYNRVLRGMVGGVPNAVASHSSEHTDSVQA
ncbi:hypothetical protein CAPTEDRAFT_191581 [Capitella teleta]|uniref:G-protein coupled receptors family 1 profile domain-containing protein n=1 Tax=Capitella teleta TaxID=283909 RepID=R7TG27_CAPTE|nr:hypothetical protein CAPTEDRAFT_191581 [Capitella teleta]|eukprot:ELT90501.1 hypothetical protein CAPTEDRAFT_191581 [Capitella teleta]